MSPASHANGTSPNVYKPQPRSHPMPTTAHRGEPIEILLVEDSPDDADLTMDALRDGRVRNRITHVEDGIQAMAFLRRQGRHGNAPRPDLILLDLNLPRKTGHEVLAEVKADPALRKIPIVVLTTSGAAEDVARSYDLHANVFVTKPVDFDHFTEVIRQIDDFFLTVAQLPPGN